MAVEPLASWGWKIGSDGTPAPTAHQTLHMPAKHPAKLPANLSVFPMLKPLKHLLNSFLALEPAQSAVDAEQALRLATAVLLVEVMRADRDHLPAEQQAVIQALTDRFHLAPGAVADLMALAQETARTANDFHAFTSRLNERFTQPQKIALVESLWHVAYADAHLDAHENHVISKVAGLLHVTHGEYIAAKMRAKAAALPLDAAPTGTAMQNNPV